MIYILNSVLKETIYTKCFYVKICMWNVKTQFGW